MESSIEETSLELARSLDRSKVLEEHLGTIESSLEAANQDLAGSRDRSKFLEERLNAMESSTSWKLTGPLRNLSYATRRLLKRTN